MSAYSPELPHKATLYSLISAAFGLQDQRISTRFWKEDSRLERYLIFNGIFFIWSLVIEDGVGSSPACKPSMKYKQEAITNQMKEFLLGLCDAEETISNDARSVYEARMTITS